MWFRFLQIKKILKSYEYAILRGRSLRYSREKIALRGKSRATSQEVDILKNNYYNLVKAAVTALDLEEKTKINQR